MPKNEVLDRLGVTENDFEHFLQQQQMRKLARRFTVLLPFAVFEAFREICQQRKDGVLSKEAADVEFDARVRPHFLKMPDGYDAARGDVVEFDYERGVFA